MVDIYETTNSFPQSELFALTNQIRRCATSISGNIAEGSGRRGNREFIQFLHISLGSATELETYLIIAERLVYISKEKFIYLNNSLSEIIKMLIGLLKSIKGKD